MNSISLALHAVPSVLILSLITSCGGGSAEPSPQLELAVSPANSSVSLQGVITNRAPIARIGGNYELLPVRTGGTVELSGSASYDPDGDPLSYQWTITAQPVGSLASLSDSAAETTEFFADVAGDYSVELVVSDVTTYSDPASTTVSVIDFTPSKLNWGMHYDYGNGEDPDVAINNHGVIVQVFETPDEFSNLLYYRVGVARGGLIDWGPRRELGDDEDDDGLFPSVGINDAGTVVAIWGNWDLTYRVGVVDPESKTIDFGPTREDFESGRHASIAINNNGHVIEVHRSRVCSRAGAAIVGCDLLYRVGTANPTNKSISFGPERDNLSKGRRPAVDLNDNNDVVIVREHTSNLNQSLYYQTARLNPGDRTLSRRESGEFDHGAYPDVAIDNAGRIVEVHKSQGKDTLWSAVGHLQENGRPALGDARPYSVGVATSVSMNDQDTFIAVNDTRIDNLFYQFTRDFPAPKNAERWMELTPTMHRKTLRQVTLPGTHDSGAYELFTTLDGDADEARGPDFYEIWVIDFLGTICDLPHPALYLTWAGLACQTFVPTPVEWNENAQDITVTQSRTIGEQLNDGMRVFDLRVTKRGDHFYLYHGLLGNRFDVALAEIRDFVQRTSNEIVFLEFSHLHTGQSEKNPFDATLHEELMADVVASLGDWMLTHDGNDRQRNRQQLLDTQLRDLTSDGSLVIATYEWKQDLAFSAEFSDYFWGIGEHPQDKLFSTGQETTPKLADQESTTREEFEAWIDSDRPRLFKQIQTLTASRDFGDLEEFTELVETQNEIITSQVFFRRFARQDYWPTLHKLSQDANHHLSTQVSVYLDVGADVAPNAITTDFYEESDVVARCIELSARCNETAITGELIVDSPRNWPPNHKMVEVTISIDSLLSANPESFGAKITGVDIIEPDRSTGENIYEPNNFEPDFEITDDLEVQLRSERDGRATGRTYVVKVLAWDCSGDYEFEAYVSVPHDQGG